MKKINTLALALACILLLMLSLTSCNSLRYAFFDEEGNFIGLDKFFRGDDANEDPNIENIELLNSSPYDLEYVSNGDGTCTVFIRIKENGAFANKVIADDEKSAIVSSKEIFYSFDGNNMVTVNPTEGISGSYYTFSSSYSVENPDTSPDGDTVTAVGDSEFSAYANVPRILSVEAFEEIVAELNSGKNGEKISSFDLDKFRAYYFLQDPSQVGPGNAYQMNQKYPATLVVPVYVLDESVTLQQLEWLSQTLDEYADYTASDYKNDFNALKSQVAEQNSAAAETLVYGNFADNIKRIALPYTVVKIAANAFAGCYNMEHIEINSDIEELGDYAFKGCKKLQKVELHNGGLTSIGEGAFMNCEDLRNIYLPESVTEIEDKAFYGCTDLHAIDLSINLQTIGKEAFYGCDALEGIVIPYATTYIGTDAFVECDSLAVAEVAFSDGWVRTDKYGNTENITFSDNATNISCLKAEGFEYTRISR